LPTETKHLFLRHRSPSHRLEILHLRRGTSDWMNLENSRVPFRKPFGDGDVWILERSRATHPHPRIRYRIILCSFRMIYSSKGSPTNPDLFSCIQSRQISCTPRDLQIIPSGHCIQVKYFSGKVQSFYQLGLHGSRIDLFY